MQPKSLLIIDDDIQLTDLLEEYLRPQGYEIDVACDGLIGLDKATSQRHYDLILLDVMLPGMDGFEVLKKLRVSHLTPVLMLTAKGDDFDRIFGLELGADDYLAKPFNHRELSARIKAITRRMDYLPATSSQQNLNINGIELSPSAQTVSCQNNKIDMTATEFLILHLLMINRGQIVSKQDISEKVMGRKLAAFDRSIDMHISNIRRKLMAQSNEDKIRTIRGTGYLFVATS
ncbi:response regulator transcription factor [Aliiglaciecola sp. LCG003]|uniref:response regulator transcription factor n=1 Tax=Aliiglaciecola sp. LCG003 TaxID=3053655 RepID=UPI0025741838|nr:response regulator transcription factor [Aliiglaciecola sp. LCG003]WJG10028.1 response regulator transcription factor [Aliiglaciecola sp. LCG003]